MRAGLLRLSSSVIAAAFLLTACGPKEPQSSGAPPDMRRLTEEQYRNTILDIFGPTITYGGRFDPLARVDGLIQLDARAARVTPAGFEQYYALARSIAAQAMSPTNRATLVACQPTAVEAPDDACAQAFLTEVGRLLYRRPLTATELSLSVKAAHDVAAERRDFYEGLTYSLAGLMMTPKFLFVIDMTEPDPAHQGQQRLTSYARASRLSYLLWNSAPDTMLLDAAAKGALDSADGLEKQAERMMESPKFENGVRAFFTDFLDLQKFETLEKDQVIYPTFNVKANEDAKEELLRTIVDHVAVRDLDYRDLFTTRRTFVSPPLARIYKVPAGRPDGGWSTYEFAKTDPRAGILTQIAFLAVNSHPGRSSPTIRGRAIRETLLCQKVPDPPGDVDFSKFNDTNSPDKTAKARLTSHRTAEAWGLRTSTAPAPCARPRTARPSIPPAISTASRSRTPPGWRSRSTIIPRRRPAWSTACIPTPSAVRRSATRRMSWRISKRPSPATATACASFCTASPPAKRSTTCAQQAQRLPRQMPPFHMRRASHDRAHPEALYPPARLARGPRRRCRNHGAAVPGLLPERERHRARRHRRAHPGALRYLVLGHGPHARPRHCR